MLNFLYGIAEAKNRGPNAELEQLVALKDLTQIYNYILVGAQPQDLRELPLEVKLAVVLEYTKYSIETINSMREIVKKIAALDSINSALHLAKEETGLPRSLEIIRELDGTLTLNILTNSKLRDHTPEKPVKKRLVRTSGGTKNGRAAAWQLVPIQKPLYKLSIGDESDFMSARIEASMTQHLNSKFISRTYAGQIYKKNNKNKLCLYSDYAQKGDLEDFLDNLKQKKIILSQQTKNKFIWDILKAIKFLHDKNLKHQDIKTANILVLGNNALDNRCVLADFGLATYSDLSDALTTTWYMSIELCYLLQTNSQNSNRNTWKSKYDKTLKKHIFGKIQLLNLSKKNQKLLLGDPKQYQFARKENDIWAFGIVAFILLHGRLPKLADRKIIDADPLLKGALDINPRTRLNVEQLLSIHTKSINKGADLDLAKDLLKQAPAVIIKRKKESACIDAKVLKTQKNAKKIKLN